MISPNNILQDPTGFDELSREYLSTLNTASIDGFRSLFYKASDEQLEGISNEYEGSSGPHREWIYDDGVQADMIRQLGEELVLISLYHSVELKIKDIIQDRQAQVPTSTNPTLNLSRWDDLKSYMSKKAKGSDEFRRVNVLRNLVNCFKHVGRVSKELHKQDSTFGDVGDEIKFDRRAAYGLYKDSSTKLISLIYKNEI